MNEKNQKPIIINSSGGLLLLKMDEVIRIETESSYSRKNGKIVEKSFGNYTRVYTIDDKVYMVVKQIGVWENELKDYGFFIRPHQSHLINKQYVRKVTKKEGTQLEMVVGDLIHRVPVATNKKSYVIKAITAA